MSKQDYLKACLNSDGILSASAMDQRGSLKKALQSYGLNATDELMERFKVQVSQVLTQEASAILLDPRYGMPAAQARVQGSALLLSYEQTGYDESQAGRLPRLVDHLSVKRLKHLGADGIKLMVYYDPFDSDENNTKKHAFIERVGSECLAEDIPFFLEPMSYNERVSDPIDLAKLKPEVLKQTIREFSKPQYAADVLKLEFPLNVKHVAGLEAAQGNETVYTEKEAQALLLDACSEATLPFVFLSAGVDMKQFVESLHFAGNAGVAFNGVLCGRATWKGGVQVFAQSGEEALRDWLESEGMLNLRMLNHALKDSATPVSLT